MALATGTRLGAYAILSPLGEGGMGEVYRARDTRLDRDVALKLLPELFAADPDRLARFEREAKTLAALNHQNIAQLYGIEESNGTHALIMELVEGEDLAARIAGGTLPLDEAIAIARGIADAVAVAHDAGIVHRDLKPANIKIRRDGTVKVLDFGLAKALAGPEAAGPHVDRGLSPTFTSPALTQLGLILGTAAYMAPEQAMGRPARRRLGLRRHPVRDADRPSAVRRRECVRHPCVGHQGRSALGRSAAGASSGTAQAPAPLPRERDAVDRARVAGSGYGRDADWLRLTPGRVVGPAPRVNSATRRALGDCGSRRQGRTRAHRPQPHVGEEPRRRVDGRGGHHARPGVPRDQQGRACLGRRHVAEGAVPSREWAVCAASQFIASRSLR